MPPGSLLRSQPPDLGWSGPGRAGHRTQKVLAMVHGRASPQALELCWSPLGTQVQQP